MTMRIEIAGFVPGMIMMLAGHFLHTFLVTVTVGVEVTRLVTRMVVVLSWFFLWHCLLLVGNASVHA